MAAASSELEELREALRGEISTSGRFSQVDEVDVEAGPGVGAHRVLLTFAPSVRVTDPDRFTATIEARYGELFPNLEIMETGYREAEPAVGVVEEDGLRIRPARGPTIVLTVRGLADCLGPGGANPGPARG